MVEELTRPTFKRCEVAAVTLQLVDLTFLSANNMNRQIKPWHRLRLL